MRIAVDFDGTIVEHKYPSIGKEKPFAVETLKLLAADGHKLILWTVRSGRLLQEAVDWCAARGLTFYAVNGNEPAGSLFEGRGNGSPKVSADLFIDDANIGGIPDWGSIYEMVSNRRLARKQKKHRSWLGRLFSRY